MLAYCGLACDTCPILQATLEKDKSRQQKMRVSIAQIITEQYKMNIHLEDITDCDGCRTAGGRLFSGCRKCEIRKCASRKHLESCAYCKEYACNLLEELLRREPGAKKRLEEIRNTLRK